MKVRLAANLAMASDIIDHDFDCGAFEIEITPEYAKTLLKRLDFVKKAGEEDSEFWEAWWWDASGVFYSRDWDADAPGGSPIDDDGKPIVLGEAQRTECDQCVVHDGKVFWSAIPKHTSVYVQTEEVMREFIEAIAKQG